MSVNKGAFHFSIKHDILGRRFASVSWVEHEYQMGTWPGERAGETDLVDMGVGWGG